MLGFKVKLKHIRVLGKNLSKSYSLILLIILAIIVELLFLISLTRSGFARIPFIVVVLYSTIFLLLIYLLIYIVVCFILSIIGRNCYNNYFKNENDHFETYDPSKECAVVLISNAQSPVMIKCDVIRYWKNIQIDSATAFLPLLIRHFKNRGVHYSLIQTVNKEKLDSMISKTNCTELYLIGHGSRGIFKTCETHVKYSEYNKPEYTSNKKKIVSQLHCNGLEYAENCTEDKMKNTSLTHILATDQENSFLTEGYIMLLDIFWYCYRLSRKR